VLDLREVYGDGTCGPVPWLMSVLLLASAIVWLATTISRLWTHARMRRHSRRFMASAEPLLKTARWTEVVELSRTARLSPVARTLGAGLEVWLAQRKAGTDLALAWQVAQASMNQGSNEQAVTARRGLRTLTVVGGTAPLAGLVGGAFQLYSALWAPMAFGSSVAASAAAGVMEALPMPAFGLFIGMLALWTGAWLSRSAERMRIETGRAAADVLDRLALQKPTDGSEQAVGN
jgi:biopolymer transport protein ExbB/TolQ